MACGVAPTAGSLVWTTVLLSAIAPAAAQVADQQAQLRPDEQFAAAQRQLLQQHGVATETASLIAFVDGLSPSADRAAEVARLVAQLGDGEFGVRESAAQQLGAFGDAARTALIAAQKSSDAEVVWRATNLVRQLESGEQAQQQRALLYAALVLLKERRSPAAVRAMFAVLPRCDEAHLEDAACEAIWASVDRSHADLLRTACRERNSAVAAAALVASEIVLEDDAIATIEPHLASDDPRLQLAAARALVDRQGQAAARVLAGLTKSADTSVALQAEGLLAAQTGNPVGETDWIKWRDTQLASTKLLPVGSARHDLSLGRSWLRESFITGIGRFEFEGNGPRALRVEGGVAAIGGDDQPECDQRLFITSQRMTGRPEFPNRCEVRVRLAAEDNNNFGWHLGVSIGRVKLLLHPSLAGGAFRAETVDTHEYLFSNEEMGFTPMPDVTHEMTIEVQRTGAGARLVVNFIDGRDKSLQFRRTIDVSEQQLGKFDRIGLERSGRPGGAAQFDEITIRLK